ncbi:MAG TPA: Mur ligase family protein, partial [Rhodothermales bacterium]|nr:Mur ligase family protein [Rhodothermales bacterium]
MLSVHASGARRLTGPGPLLGGTGAALDLTGPPTARGEAAIAWAGHASALLAALGWGGAPVTHAFTGGTSLAVPAPPDRLYTAAALVEAAWAAAQEGAPPVDVDALRAQADAEAEPVLVALEAAALAHGVSYLRGDDLVSLGHGTHGQAWPEDAPPAPEDVAWDAVADVPVALVTGTNGKTTTVRMLAVVLAAAGHVPAFTTTDSITVGDEVLETGDCSGPQSARRALRHPATTAAALEIARGGLLRRGLPLPRATAAAVTNVDADHLGEYGIETVEELAAVKFAVHHALTAGGLLVTSADDPLSLRTARALVPALNARGVALGLVALRPDHPAFEG